MIKKYNLDLWPMVKQIVLDHYKEIITERLRDGWYIVREYLNKDYLKKGKITERDYEHFLDNYFYYTQDLWPQIEREGYERPRAKEIGIIYNLGEEMTVSQFEDVSHRARGFIFVEKAGEAEDIKDLSEHGWAIIAGQGYSTRLMRELIKEDKRPLLVLHDADTSGEWIYRIFGEGSKRTKHLELWLENVKDLGLNEHDSKLLELPSQLEAKQYRDKKKMRWELSAFTLLKKRLGLKNPVLAYTIAKMRQLGIRITPTEAELKMLLQWTMESEIRVLLTRFTSRLEEIIASIPDYAYEIAGGLNYPEGKAVHAIPGKHSTEWIDYFDGKSHIKLFDILEKTIDDELEKIKPWIIKESQKMIDNPVITDVDTYEEDVVEKLNGKKMIELLR